MGQYLDFKARPNETRSRQDFIEFLKAKGFKNAMGYDKILEIDRLMDDEFYVKNGIIVVCSEKDFEEGELAYTRLSWAVPNEIFLEFMDLAEELGCDLYDDDLHITPTTLKEFIDRFTGTKNFYSRGFGMINEDGEYLESYEL